MHYQASITDFFKTPSWRNNLLLGAVTMFIPIIGPIVLLGWHVCCLWTPGKSDDPGGFPPFDFNQAFGKYMERGLWPFVVGLVTSLVIIPLFAVIGGLLILLGSLASEFASGDPGPAIVLFIVASLVLDIAALAVFQLVSTPFVIRAILTQDFKSSFDLAFLRSFIALTWKEILVSLLFMTGIAVCMVVLAIVTCYIGAIFAAPVVSFSWHHLQKQIYQTYLSRGGQPVPTSPKLSDQPPPLPIPAGPPPMPGT